jgi:transposase InsO family protein
MVATTTTMATSMVLDSGASRHVEPDVSTFTTLADCQPVDLRGISGTKTTITRAGTVGNCMHVLHAPGASASVRSVGTIVDTRPVSVTFTPTAAYTHPHLAMDSAVRIATRAPDGLYHIVRNSIPPIALTATALYTVSGQVKRERVHQLHQLLGHASQHVMRKVLQDNPKAPSGLVPSDVRLFTSCDACQLGKAKRLPRPTLATTRSHTFGYRLHTDTTGRVRPRTRSGYGYANITVDDSTRYVWVTLLKTMAASATADAIGSVLASVSASESTLPTRVLRHDNGTELLNSTLDELLARASIQRERTCPATSNQNGVAERTIGVLFAATRTLLVDAALPPSLWGEALLTATYVHNRLPTSANVGMASPFEARHGRVPDLRRLRPFGTTAYVRRTDHLSIPKIAPRADRGIFLGYGEDVTGQKGWRVYLPSKKRVVTSADVTFTRDLQQAVSTRRANLDAPNPLPTMEPTAGCPRSRTGTLGTTCSTSRALPSR